MSDVEEFVKVLQDWKEQPGKTITSVLTRIEESKSFKGRELDEIYKGVVDFHREIGKADESLVDLKWYQLCISSKKKLKKAIESAEKLKKSQPILEKKPSSTLLIEIPEQLIAGRGTQDEQFLKYLYKSFVSNCEQAISNPKTVPFIISTLKEIKYKFDDRIDDSVKKRILSIGARLAKQNSKQSKIRMLNGQITPKQLSNDDQELYFDQKTKDNIRKIQMEELEKCRTGFYDEMKKQINKDACEQCKFCRKKAAYCQDQKQIRASDQPMTRFMRCNACEKGWRD